MKNHIGVLGPPVFLVVFLNLQQNQLTSMTKEFVYNKVCNFLIMWKYSIAFNKSINTYSVKSLNDQIMFQIYL